MRCLETIARPSGDFEAGEVGLALDRTVFPFYLDCVLGFFFIFIYFLFYTALYFTALHAHLNLCDCSSLLRRYVLPMLIIVKSPSTYTCNACTHEHAVPQSWVELAISPGRRPREILWVTPGWLM